MTVDIPYSLEKLFEPSSAISVPVQSDRTPNSVIRSCERLAAQSDRINKQLFEARAIFRKFFGKGYQFGFPVRSE